MVFADACKRSRSQLRVENRRRDEGSGLLRVSEWTLRFFLCDAGPFMECLNYHHLSYSCLSPSRHRSRFQVGSDAGGIKAISRSVERSDTTGCDTKNTTHPIGMPALPCCCAIVMSRRRTTCFPHKMACFALNASPLASLWDAGRSGLTNRWCRRVAPQPPYRCPEVINRLRAERVPQLKPGRLLITSPPAKTLGSRRMNSTTIPHQEY